MLQPYLLFNGNGAEALQFYQTCFEGAQIALQRFSDFPGTTADAHQDRLMHGEVFTDDMVIMGSDGLPGMEAVVGNNVVMNLYYTDLERQADVFQKLSAGGKAHFPLQVTDWGIQLGICTDRFGVTWMTQCPLPKA